ncbi:hypothetical protein [Ammoniphilus sp. CFH 90114]|uniref:hypothetical protein n=1 Tax=Ammoniphilus sp. CFH 90114 TaxID=2493665 RepID=UPI00100EB7C7|nr:hypothetical protein [Ammoniphilus sp. CFH 90114]RXT07814.1 hypothetical protein EIZ39_10305 [Ammoniphilus sp. CFH 90114]
MTMDAVKNGPVAKKSEVKAYEEFVVGSRNAVWYMDYVTEVQRLEKEDPTLLEPSEWTKAKLKLKLQGYIAYR